MEPTALDRDFARFRSTADAEALARVFDASAPELLRIARHLTGDRAEAEDVLQSTFLAVIERAETHDPARPALPWMIGILARQAGLARRKRSSLARLAAAEELDEARAREVESPSRVAERREFAERLGVALAQLPAGTRTLDIVDIGRHLDTDDIDPPLRVRQRAAKSTPRSPHRRCEVASSASMSSEPAPLSS